MALLSLAARAAAAALVVLATLPAFAQSPTRTRLFTASPSPIGEPVRMTAEVDTLSTGGAPRGAVSFADGATLSGSAPLIVSGAGQATLAAGWYHTCGLTNSGGVMCWGWNRAGQIGTGEQVDRYPTPTQVLGLETGIVAIAAGPHHSCALDNLGAVKCWGYNSDGRLGDGTDTQRFSPTPVSGLTSGVVAIATGAEHSCALTSEGRVMCWGRGDEGQLGDGGSASSNVPKLVVDEGTRYQAVTAGGYHSCGLTTAGAVKCWGANARGQLGDKTTITRRTPVQTFGLASGVSAIAAGAQHSCAVTTAGALKCWGFNQLGAIGDGNAYDRRMPAQVVGLEGGVVAVSAGSDHSCALLSSGGVRCWGYNGTGQLGDGTVLKRYSPAPVSGLGGFAVALAAGGTQSCALLSPSRILRCWGSNFYGAIGDGANLDRHLPVSAVNFRGVLRGRARLAAPLAPGAHPLRASFAGDAGLAPSSSAIVTHTVQ
jgi:alpha-tubulin suppressor-like RCC1 family protein